MRSSDASSPVDALLAECDAFIVEHRRKADTNERRARAATASLAGTSAAIPVLIIAASQGSEFVLGKLLPATFAAIAAVLATLLQLERPHERWSLYRRYQRVFEAERLLYIHNSGPYGGADADARFTEWLARQKVAVHDDWATLVAPSSEVASLAPGTGHRAEGLGPAVRSTDTEVR